MGNIFDIINVPLGFLFRVIFMLVQNYGWALYDCNQAYSFAAFHEAAKIND